MQIQVFRIPVAAEQAEVDEINRFLASHKVVNIDKQFVEAGQNSFWALFVNYASGEPTSTQTAGKRIDYKEVLTPEDFAVYSKLRNVRKELAEKDGVPVYAVFSNEQLAEIAKRRASSLNALSEIKGVGKAKVDKYGAAITQALLESVPVDERDNGQAFRSDS